MQQPGSCLDPLPQHIHQGQSGSILDVQHPAVAVGRLQGGGQAIAIPIEGHAQLQQAFHSPWCFVHEQVHRIGVAETVPGPLGVIGMAGHAVVRTRHRRNAPWAQRLEERRPVLRLSNSTESSSGSSRQVISPAAPAPTTTTSQGPGAMGVWRGGLSYVPSKKPPDDPTALTGSHFSVEPNQRY